MNQVIHPDPVPEILILFPSERGSPADIAQFKMRSTLNCNPEILQGHLITPDRNRQLEIEAGVSTVLVHHGITRLVEDNH